MYPWSLEKPVAGLRKRRAPSVRDREIYADHKVHGRQQKELAKEHELSKGRVSQIVKRVAAWRSDLSPDDGELEHDQQHRLERQLARERLEELYGQSLRILRDAEKPATTRRKGKRTTPQGEKLGWWDRTEREQPGVRLQALKTALRAAEDLSELADREPPPAPPTREKPGVTWQQLDWELERRMAKAKYLGSEPPAHVPERVVDNLLRALAGHDLAAVRDPAVQQALGSLGTALLAVSLGGRYIEGQPRDLDEAALAALAAAAPQASGAPSAKLTKPSAPADEPEFPPEVTEAVARCYAEARRYGVDVAAIAAAEEASLAPENSAEFSAEQASGGREPPETNAGDESAAEVGSACRAEPELPQDIAPAASVSSPQVPLGKRDLPAAPGPARQAGPTGIEVVGSPEWQIARAKWLADRDRRRIEEARRKSLDDATRAAEIRAIRAAAAQRRAWLEAGRVQW
jgi:hypothetical protein